MFPHFPRIRAKNNPIWMDYNGLTSPHAVWTSFKPFVWADSHFHWWENNNIFSDLFGYMLSLTNCLTWHLSRSFISYKYRILLSAIQTEFETKTQFSSNNIHIFNVYSSNYNPPLKIYIFVGLNLEYIPCFDSSSHNFSTVKGRSPIASYKKIQNP
jgi:hypothetical protein